MANTDCDVLIVGGGPTGITLGLMAAQYGASVLICEKELDVFPLPRAAHIDHEVLRIFQSIGAGQQIAASSRTTPRYDFLTADGQVLLRFEGSDQISHGGWPAANMIHQPSLERALRSRLSPADVPLQSSWSFTGFVESEERICASFDTPGGPRAVSARYLIGADGARSQVRTSAGVELDDLKFDEPWLVIDAIVHDFERLPKINLQICDPARPTTCVLMGEGRHRWEFMIGPGERPEDVLKDDFIESLLEPWNVRDAVTLERKAVYRFNAKIAKQWRKGRVLLAGDAAHQTPPFAGQGLGAGARDAANLGWKLGMIISGQAPDALLDTYQPEREPNARATIEMAMMMGRTVCITDPAAAAERDRVMLTARSAGQAPDGRMEYPGVASGLILEGSPAAGQYFPQIPPDTGADRLDDILGPGAWLISSEPATTPFSSLLLDLTDPDLTRWAAGLSDWLFRHKAKAVLVRPDRYVFGTGQTKELASAWIKALACSPSLATSA